jgi:hypothetical protein
MTNTLHRSRNQEIKEAASLGRRLSADAASSRFSSCYPEKQRPKPQFVDGSIDVNLDDAAPANNDWWSYFSPSVYLVVQTNI